MAITVLIVDDSLFFQKRLIDIIEEHPQLKVVGAASNGKQALAMTLEKKPDVITMDYEMPLMDGIHAVRKIMSQRPTPILMFSSLTYDGAKTTLSALEAGAMDFMPKSFKEIAKNPDQLKDKLHQRILLISRRRNLALNNKLIDHGPQSTAHKFDINKPQDKRLISPHLEGEKSNRERTDLNSGSDTQAGIHSPPSINSNKKLNEKIKLIAIGASTGGPIALSEILKHLPKDFSLPILVVQHMPENFTKAFAERLNNQCNIRVMHAEDGMEITPGCAYLAPGGRQMVISQKDSSKIKVLNGDDRLLYKPSVDITIASAANAWGTGLLTLILTGMGTDGCEGSRIVKQKGGVVWSQDEASSIIYGMPMAVAKEKLTDRVIALNEISGQLKKVTGY